MIEKGRHYCIPREHRNCVYCDIYIEDELHFVMFCPLYEELRVHFIDRRFLLHPSVESFVRLMSAQNEQVIRNLAMYLYYAFKKRQEFIDGTSF